MAATLLTSAPTCKSSGSHFMMGTSKIQTCTLMTPRLAPSRVVRTQHGVRKCQDDCTYALLTTDRCILRNPVHCMCATPVELNWEIIAYRDNDALFGFGKSKFEGPMLCIDCGYVVQQGFNDLPNNYKCPQCNVGKNRFKPMQEAGSSYNSLAEQRKAVRAAKAAAKSEGGMSKREQMKARLMEAQNETDSKKKGWFGR